MGHSGACKTLNKSILEHLKEMGSWIFKQTYREKRSYFQIEVEITSTEKSYFHPEVQENNIQISYFSHRQR